MTKERAWEIKRSVFDNYYGYLETLSDGFDGYDRALNFGRILGFMEAKLELELSMELEPEIEVDRNEDSN